MYQIHQLSGFQSTECHILIFKLLCSKVQILFSKALNNPYSKVVYKE